MEMREGAAQGHPDNTQWFAESLHLCLFPHHYEHNTFPLLMYNSNSVKIQTYLTPYTNATQWSDTICFASLMDSGTMILKRYVHTFEDLYISELFPLPNNEI